MPIPPINQVCEVCVALGLANRWIEQVKDEHEIKLQKEKKGGKKTRIKEIVNAVNADVGEDVVSSGWQDLLSATDRRVIHLARAIITNPHVLVLHRPLTSLDEDVAEKVLDALRLFITNRSLFSDSKPSSLLSRTVIFSTTTVYERALEVSDDVIVVGTPTGSATLIRGDDKKAAPSAALLSQSGNGEEEGSPIGSPAGRRNMLRKMCSEPDWNRQSSLSEMSEEHLHDLLPRLSGAQEALLSGNENAAGANDHDEIRRSRTTPNRPVRAPISLDERPNADDEPAAALSSRATRVTGWKGLKMGLRKPSVIAGSGATSGSDAVRSAAMIVARQSRATKANRRNSDDLQNLL
jgi:hypothetical protein